MPTDADAPIFLVGFMASGKTTVGRLVAERLRAATVPASPAETLAPSAPALIEGAHA